MKTREWLTLLIFLSTVFIGPNTIYSNKYLITLIPFSIFLFIIFIFKNEWLDYDLNRLKERSFYIQTFQVFQYSIFAQAIGSLIFGESISTPESFIKTYTLIPLYLVITGPIIEEVVFRKIIFLYILKKTNFIVAATISSSLFSLIHFNQTRFLIYFAIGFIVCWFYYKFKTLAPIISAHIFLNFIALFMLNLKT